jgi:hypothetical protein
MSDYVMLTREELEDVVRRVVVASLTTPTAEGLFSRLITVVDALNDRVEVLELERLAQQERDENR